MDDELTHRITITITGRYLHGKEQEHATVTVSGSGDIDHMIQAFQAALVAAGFATATAERIGLKDD